MDENEEGMSLQVRRNDISVQGEELHLGVFFRFFTRREGSLFGAPPKRVQGMN